MTQPETSPDFKSPAAGRNSPEPGASTPMRIESDEAGTAGPIKKRQSRLRIETPDGPPTKRPRRAPPLTPMPRLASPFRAEDQARDADSLPTPYLTVARKEFDSMTNDAEHWRIESQQVLHFHHNHIEVAMREFSEHAKNEVQDLSFNAQKMGEDCIKGVVNPLKIWLAHTANTFEQMQGEIASQARDLEEAFLLRLIRREI